VFLFGMIALTASFAHFANHHWAALHLHAELGATAEVAGFGYACYRGATAAGQFLGPWLIGRFGETGVLVCGFFLAALSSLATSWAAHLPGGWAVAFAGYLLLGIGLANAVPITVAWGGRYGGSRGVSRTQAVSGVGVIVQAPPHRHARRSPRTPHCVVERGGSLGNRRRDRHRPAPVRPHTIARMSSSRIGTMAYPVGSRTMSGP
jgi:hypothetical protein